MGLLLSTVTVFFRPPLLKLSIDESNFERSDDTCCVKAGVGAGVGAGGGGGGGGGGGADDVIVGPFVIVGACFDVVGCVGVIVDLTLDSLLNKFSFCVTGA